MPPQYWMLMQSTALQGDIVAVWVSYWDQPCVPVLYSSLADAHAEREVGEFVVAVRVEGEYYCFENRRCTVEQLRKEAGR